jgi:hypothetical protein
MLHKLLVRLRRHGLSGAAHQLSLGALNCFVEFKILRALYVERPDPAFLGCPGPYTAGFLPEKTLRQFASDAKCELSDDFLDATLLRGDECYAICDGEALAAYGWYSCGPTPIGLPGLLLQFSPAYVYMYKGFTHDRYRGQRLHAIGMTMALRHYVSNGFKGIVSYVESGNFDSLKSCFRMGYRVFGSVYVIKLFGRYFTFTSPGCEKFGFRLARIPRQWFFKAKPL